jgi:hypothetical protein
MTYVSRILVLLFVGLFIVSASASADDRLTVSGLIDNIAISTDNLSLSDRHYTSLSLGTPENPGQAGDQDSLSYAVTRFNLRFAIEAFENSRAVVQVHGDREWGQSGVLFTNEHDKYSGSIGAYGGVLTLEGSWFEGLIPGTAAKFEIGIPYMNAEFGGWGESNKIFNTAAPGITLSAPFSDTISTYTWYAWLGQDFDGYGPTFQPGTAAKLSGNGDDWAAGTRVQFALMEGMAVDLGYVFHMNEAGAGKTGDVSRNWIHGKLWYQYGDFSLAPSLTMYLASADGGMDTESLLLDLRAKYVTGPLSLEGRIVYTPASEYDSAGNKVTDRDYGILGVWGIPQSVQWFALMGNHDLTYLGPAYVKSIQVNLRQDSFGLMHAAAKAAYTLTPQTTLSVSVGLFNAADDPQGVPGGLAGRKLNGAAEGPDATYAGGSTHVATEIDAWLAYQLYPNASISLWAAYAMTGDALNLMMNNTVYESQDVLGAGALVRYTF